MRLATTTSEIDAAPGKIADMYTKMNASRSYVYAVARACDAGQVSRRVRIPVVIAWWIPPS